MNDTTTPRKLNAVFWLIWMLPGSAVLASFATLAIALHGADRALPATYHWEGERLDADFARARRGASLGVAVTLEVARGECVATVRNAPGGAATLELELANAATAALDRALVLQRDAAGSYRGECADLPAGRWWISLREPTADWSVRARVEGPLTSVELRARDPAGRQT
jgi:uncharacterized protein